jgi:hypothetical protein
MNGTQRRDALTHAAPCDAMTLRGVESQEGGRWS